MPYRNNCNCLFTYVTQNICSWRFTFATKNIAERS